MSLLSRTLHIRPHQASLLLPCILGICLSSCSTPASKAQLDPKTDSVLNAMSAKLTAAKTLRVTGSRTTSPGFRSELNIAESANGSVTVQRPNRLLATMKTNHGAREISLGDGKVTLVDHAGRTYASVKAPGDIDETLRSISRTYGVTPPVAELLVNHPRKFLLEGVSKGRHVATEQVGAFTCDRLAFTQPDVTWELWVDTKEHLPRRITVTYPASHGSSPETITANISRWELDVPVGAKDLTAKIPSGSTAVEMIPIAE